MAYQGSTAASTLANPPVMVVQPMAFSSSNVTGTADITRGGPRQWHYNSTDLPAAVGAANFFTDGLELGMKVGDTLILVGSTTFLVTSHVVTAVGATTTKVTTGAVFST